MQQKLMNVELRSKTGKGVSRQLRSADKVPGVVYGKGMDPMAVSVNHRDLQAAMAGGGGRNNLITLVGGGGLDQSMAIVSDLQRDAIKGTYKHVDLHRINMNEKFANCRAGCPEGYRNRCQGGWSAGLCPTMNCMLSVLPANIPDNIEIDVANLSIAHSIHVSEIQLPEGVKVLDNPKTPVVSVLGRAKEEAVSEPAALTG